MTSSSIMVPRNASVRVKPAVACAAAICLRTARVFHHSQPQIPSPTTAMTVRADGTIFVDDSKCVGCRYCEWACPYSAPQFNVETGHMSKCDLCFDYRQEGLTPACVAACPSRALDWGPLAELEARYPGGVRSVAPLPDPSITEPNLLVRPHRDAQPVGSGVGSIANPKEV